MKVVVNDYYLGGQDPADLEPVNVIAHYDGGAMLADLEIDGVIKIRKFADFIVITFKNLTTDQIDRIEITCTDFSKMEVFA